MSSFARHIHANFTIDNRYRMGFAHVCVEIDVFSSFSKSVNLYKGLDESTSEPKLMSMPVEYQWVPSIYSHC